MEQSGKLTVPGFPSANAGPLLVGLAFSIVLHSVLLLLNFSLPEFKFPRDSATPIEVVLVNAKSKTKPRKADALAQADLDGGGNTEAERRAKSNLPVLPDMPEDAEVSLAARRVQQLEAETQKLLAQLKLGDTATSVTNYPLEQRERSDAPSEADLPSQKLEIARLEAQIAKQWDAYQKLPKRKFIGARTESVIYAEYVDEWRQKIERVGTSNFPEQAKRDGVLGNVMVTVAIKADGSVEKIEIDRSSGSRILDAAVERIVQLAAPFKPFPSGVRRETDILHITRNWSFTRTDLLLSDQ